MRQPINFWQFLVTIGVVLVTATAYVNGMYSSLNERAGKIEVIQEGQQKQIDELKVSNGQIQGMMGNMKDDIGDIKGDVKVILSKIK